MEQENVGMEYFGEWYLPDNSDDSNLYLTGLLSIRSDQRAELRVIGTEEVLVKKIPELENTLRNFSNQNAIPLIIGYAKNLKTNRDTSIALTDVIVTGYNRSGLALLTLEPKYTVEGLEFKNKHQLRFFNAMVRFEGIDELFENNSFETDSHGDSDGFKSTVTYTQPEPIDLFASDECKVYLYFRAKAPGFSVNRREALIQESVFINIEFTPRASLEYISMLIERIQNFCSFALGLWARRIRTELTYLSRAENPNGHYYPELNLYYYDDLSERMKASNSLKQLFNLKDFEDVSRILPLWFELYDKYEPGMRQYFDNFYFRNGHTVSRFVSSISFIEIYYYRNSQDDVALRTAINSLIQRFEAPALKLAIDINSFPNDIVNLRKLYVHGTVTSATPENREELQASLTRQLTGLIKVIIISELGFTNERIAELIDRYPYKW